MRPGRQRWRYHNQLLLLLLFLLPGVANSVKCYCTDDHCVPYGSCDGTVCLVGILRDSNQVIRTCGTNTLGCHKNEDDKWTDLCACDQPFCNTFAFLRTHTRFNSTHSALLEELSMELQAGGLRRLCSNMHSSAMKYFLG
ncbi:Activin_recp domain-containing protein [Caenorhabditis elegans]|uniref:Activin_recp domain-containing protein n=1 Tax=Caenorhabditis elegans TaxID=6239 RepID=B2MZC7_CAEEL|nr:Activin_recp domain-containing protein [Caenorhabditis elegans]CAQ48393.1 Activin_recp domain-containing protein [Caenorhabditis elegans]|eukprot:NP_001129860.1 Uncharacterized protein CELE_H01G02.3 [Caenorhabditis elegans]